ncbi:hypothetical protein [Thermosediminibacter oceani]|uniref:Uncharacterized protein n=1 Tax=Thermosediminibacter oceani (strain ATCC BAA-1034 / DSM 16646 / JW/IW-1228P) TaxID=555079 RepID=D9S3M7_THEOJ|nr:hypothetical protein [Thermosediminibacter oceani]ADL08004.1 hypothetical protein Toce_1248 [Thermosediminibacter oceani DSM 16646]
MNRRIPVFIKLLFLLLFINVFLLIFTIYSTNSTPEKYLRKILKDIEIGSVLEYKEKNKLLEIKKVFDMAKKVGLGNIGYHISYLDSKYRVYVYFLEDYSNNSFKKKTQASGKADDIKLSRIILDFKLKRKYLLLYELEDVSVVNSDINELGNVYGK